MWRSTRKQLDNPCMCERRVHARCEDWRGRHSPRRNSRMGALEWRETLVASPSFLWRWRRDVECIERIDEWRHWLGRDRRGSNIAVATLPARPALHHEAFADEYLKSRDVKTESRGNIAGCLLSESSNELFKRPPMRRMPSESTNDESLRSGYERGSAVFWRESRYPILC